MILETVVVGALQVNCYVLGCEQTRQAVVIDPGDDLHGDPGGSAQARSDPHPYHRYPHTFRSHAGRTALAGCHRRAVLSAPRRASRPGLMRRMTLAWMAFDPGEPPRIDGELRRGSR